MNAGSHAHQEAQELLPWLANGSLSGTERERVQAHVQVCAACRTELCALHTLRAAGSAAVPDLDAEAALARLLPQLDAPASLSTASLAPVSAADPVLPGWRTRLAANDRSWLRAAVALQFGAIAVLATLLARPAASPEAQAGAYRLLGAADGVRGSLVVAFSPETPEREVRRILLASGARVVGGPTATGAWLLDTGDAPTAVVARLRAEALGGAEGRP
jgi:hypothetical protein